MPVKEEEVKEEKVEERTVERRPPREVVVPGELLDEKKGRKLGDGVYAEGDKVFAKALGIPFIGSNEMKVIPMSGVYIPRMNDRIVGVIDQVQISGWLVNINSPYISFLPVSDGVDEFVDTHRMDLTRFFDIGDVIYCKISKVTMGTSVRVSMRSMGARKLFDGSVIKVKPTKVPRLIGKGGSMINLIKNSTGCSIYVGKNGVVWIRGENKSKAIEAIMMSERESHTIGLTDKIEKMLSDGRSKTKKAGEEKEKEPSKEVKE
jgi:exosome complex component RRP4